MNKENKKSLVALTLLVGLGVLSIAYAAISSTLNIKSGGDTRIRAAAVQFNGTKSYPVAIGSISTTSENDDFTSTDGTTWTSKENSGNVDNIDEQTKAFGKIGSVAISTTTKANDTATISGTEIYDFGAYMIYQLGIINRGNTAVKLVNDPTVTINGDGKDNLLVGVYKDAECNSEVAKWSSGNTLSENYLPGNGETFWYVKISHKLTDAPDAQSYPSIVSGDFSFNIAPTWENVN